MAATKTRHRSTRLVVLPGLAIVALALTTNALPASAATARSEATKTATSTDCQDWYVLGLHGLGEGPSSSTDTNISTELTRFASDLKTDGPTYGYAVEENVPYPTISPSWQDAAGVFNQGPLWQNVQQGVADLQAAVTKLTSTCPGSLISLFGYSEGAWIINVWEQKYPDEATQIYSAGLIGDPCYVDSIGDAGLARLFTNTCGSPADYIVGETNIQPTNTDCLNYDPVCGVRYLGSNSDTLALAQLVTAVTCTLSNGCPHFLYVPDGDVANMAVWMLTDTT